MGRPLASLHSCADSAPVAVCAAQAYLLSDSDSSGDASGGGGSSASEQQLLQQVEGAAPALAQPAAGSTAPTAAGVPDSLEAAAAYWHSLRFPPPLQSAVLVATGASAGIASGLLGVGGGLVVTPLLALTTTFDHGTVLGTSLLAMIPPASAALLQHHRWVGHPAAASLSFSVGEAASCRPSCCCRRRCCCCCYCAGWAM